MRSASTPSTSKQAGLLLSWTQFNGVSHGSVFSLFLAALLKAVEKEHNVERRVCLSGKVQSEKAFGFT